MPNTRRLQTKPIVRPTPHRQQYGHEFSVDHLHGPFLRVSQSKASDGSNPTEKETLLPIFAGQVTFAFLILAMRTDPAVCHLDSKHMVVDQHQVDSLGPTRVTIVVQDSRIRAADDQ